MGLVVSCGRKESAPPNQKKNKIKEDHNNLLLCLCLSILAGRVQVVL